MTLDAVKLSYKTFADNIVLLVLASRFIVYNSRPPRAEGDILLLVGAGDENRTRA